MLPALGRCLASWPIELATSRHATSASSTASGRGPPAWVAPAAIDRATAPAGAIEVTDWNRTSRSPIAPAVRPGPVTAMAPSFIGTSGDKPMPCYSARAAFRQRIRRGAYGGVMSLFQRAHDILQAKANKALDAAEKPDEMLDLSYEQMLDQITKVRQALVTIAASRKQIELQ